MDAIWEAPKWRGEAPTASPAYDVVAALRDLFAELVGNAEVAIAEAATRTRMTVSAHSAHVPLQY